MNDSLVNTSGMLDTTKQPIKDYSTLELNPAANKNITVAGPLADVFTMALNQAYAKKTEDLEDQNADVALNEDRELNQEHQGEPNSERNNDSGYGMLVTADGNLTGLEAISDEKKWLGLKGKLKLTDDEAFLLGHLKNTDGLSSVSDDLRVISGIVSRCIPSFEVMRTIDDSKSDGDLDLDEETYVENVFDFNVTGMEAREFSDCFIIEDPDENSQDIDSILKLKKPIKRDEKISLFGGLIEYSLKLDFTDLKHFNLKVDVKENIPSEYKKEVELGYTIFGNDKIQRDKIDILRSSNYILDKMDEYRERDRIMRKYETGVSSIYNKLKRGDGYGGGFSEETFKDIYNINKTIYEAFNGVVKKLMGFKTFKAIMALTNSSRKFTFESYTAGPIPLTNEIANGGQTKPAYIYTTTAQDVKSETIEEIEDKVKEKSDAFTLVIDDSTPSFDNKEHVEALESLVLQHGGKVYRGYFASYAACESIEFGGNMVKKVLKYTDEDAKNLVLLFGSVKDLKSLNGEISSILTHLKRDHTLLARYENVVKHKEKGDDYYLDTLINAINDYDDLIGNLRIIRYNENSGEPRLNHNQKDTEVSIYTYAGCIEDEVYFDMASGSEDQIKFSNFHHRDLNENHEKVDEITITFGVFDFVKSFKGKVESLLTALNEQQTKLKSASFVKALEGVDKGEIIKPLFTELDKAREKQVKSIEKQIGLIKHLFKDIL